jgi:hypothetical protein
VFCTRIDARRLSRSRLTEEQSTVVQGV